MFVARHMPVLAISFALWAGTAKANPDLWRVEWPDTYFSRTTIDFADVISGGPPKDGIPALDGASLIPVAAETRLDDREPVMLTSIQARPPAPGRSPI